MESLPHDPLPRDPFPRDPSAQKPPERIQAFDELPSVDSYMTPLPRQTPKLRLSKWEQLCKLFKRKKDKKNR